MTFILTQILNALHTAGMGKKNQVSQNLTTIFFRCEINSLICDVQF